MVDYSKPIPVALLGLAMLFFGLLAVVLAAFDFFLSMKLYFDGLLVLFSSLIILNH